MALLPEGDLLHSSLLGLEDERGAALLPGVGGNRRLHLPAARTGFGRECEPVILRLLADDPVGVRPDADAQRLPVGSHAALVGRESRGVGLYVCLFRFGVVAAGPEKTCAEQKNGTRIYADVFHCVC